MFLSIRNAMLNQIHSATIFDVWGTKGTGVTFTGSLSLSNPNSREFEGEQRNHRSFAYCNRSQISVVVDHLHVIQFPTTVPYVVVIVFFFFFCSWYFLNFNQSVQSSGYYDSCKNTTGRKIYIYIYFFYKRQFDYDIGAIRTPSNLSMECTCPTDNVGYTSKP